jgi:hypothetical protein
MLGLVLLLTACATIGPPQPPSLDLPTPPADLRASRLGDQVTLTWTNPRTTTDRQTLRSLGPTRICRGPGELKQCGTPIGTTATKLGPAAKIAQQAVTVSYADTLPPQMQSDTPDTIITYSVEVLNRDGRAAGLSNQVHVPLIRTLPAPQDLHGQVTSQGIVLSWTADVPSVPFPAVHYIFRVNRTVEGGQEATVAGEVPATTEQRYSLTDSSIEWEKTYLYRAETVTAVDEPGKPEMRVEGAGSPELKIFAHDVFPPAVPTGLQAVFSGPGQSLFIDLVWAPAADVDLAGYNVYRHEEGTATAKLNAEPLKTPAYRDKDITTGKRYFYSVSSVDVRGNESARSEEATETVPQ